MGCQNSRAVTSHQAQTLRVGELSLLLENGFVRYIKWGKHEVVRMLYYAVRDENWATLPQTIEKLEIVEKKRGIDITYQARTQHPQIDFHWQCAITLATNTVTFQIDGEALSDFSRNRIGFCVLHPIETCKGKAVAITHPDGKVSQDHFPEHISPHQPFKNIAAMHWEVGNAQATLRFEGDVFEAEDQRNWLDASYKTYCTPLGLPFPVKVKKGDKVLQRIHLHLEPQNAVQVVSEEEKLVLNLGEKRFSLPLLGLEAKEEELDAFVIEKLKNLPLNHLRVEARLGQGNWETHLKQRIQQAKLLELPIELVVFPYQNEHQKLVSFDWKEIKMASILLLDEKEKVIARTKLETPLKAFRKAFPQTPIGTGTDFYFTELNRNRPDTAGLDFLAFSCNAQVHAFDELSIVETAQTFADVVATAHTFANGLPIHLSPITLKPRSNPDATAAISAEEQRLNRLDERQPQPLTALWFLASLKHLAQATTESAVFFQTLGEEGIMMPNRASHFPNFGAKAWETFPVFHAMQLLNKYTSWQLLQTTSTHPLQFEGLVFEKGDSREAILLNFKDTPLQTQIGEKKVEVNGKEWSVETLD